MIIFRNQISRPERTGMLSILEHPEYVICELQAKRLNGQQLVAKCNLHPGSDALISVDLVEKKLTYRIEDVCCDSFRQDLEQLVLQIRKSR